MSARVILVLGLIWTVACTGQSEMQESQQARSVYMSVFQVIQSQEVLEGKSLMVTGFLSGNCGGLCLYAYQDDAKLRNIPNAVRVMLDAYSISEIVEACGSAYVTLIGEFGVIQGFTRAGFVEVREISITAFEIGDEANVCWKQPLKEHSDEVK